MQWALGLDPPPEWRAAVLQVAAHDFYDGLYPDQHCALRLEMALIAGMAFFHQSAGTGPYLRALLRLMRHLKHAATGVPLLAAYRRALGGRRQEFEDWITHPYQDDLFWAGADAGPAADRMTMPVSLVTGWHDGTLDQTLRQYARLRRAGQEPTLMIGPGRTPRRSTRAGPRSSRTRWSTCGCTCAARASARRESRCTSTTSGASCPPGRRRAPRPATTCGRTASWARSADRRAPASTTTRPTRRRRSRASCSPAPPGPATTRPWRRGPTSGRSPPAPLTTAIEIIGTPAAELYASGSTGHFDLFARLCDVHPDGRSVNVCDGFARLTPDHPDGELVTVPMGAAGHRFEPGHRIRLQVSGGAHPRFARNYGTGEPLATAVELVATRTTVHHDPARPSALVLPVHEPGE